MLTDHLLLFFFFPDNIKPVIENKNVSTTNMIETRKGSQILMHWDVTLNPYHGSIVFVRQIFALNITSQREVMTVAEKVGEAGKFKLSSSLPSRISGRISVLNNYFRLDNVGYNDTNIKFVLLFHYRIRGTITEVHARLSTKTIVSVSGK